MTILDKAQWNEITTVSEFTNDPLVNKTNL